MKWIKLFNKIVRQPIKITNNTDVKLINNNTYYDLELIYVDNKPYFKIKEDEKIHINTFNITKGNCDLCLQRHEEAKGEIYYIGVSHKVSINLCKKHFIRII